ncbi:hypothetical protein DVH24_035124 [Malus domestica]|uniref:Protein kinase domain-containing protein n=1 Tax=Malus domestica TaxID=3750 RepID=A0A498IK98_MALDO|nr:hypothetical protein DVH24_035124 [Malus domestica]
MWNHGERWLRGALIGQGSFASVFLATPNKRTRGLLTGNLPAVMAVKSAELSASESIQHEAAVLFEIKGCPFIIERFGEETTTTDKGHKVYNLLLEFAAGGTLDGLIQRSNGHGLPEAEVKGYARSILEGVKHVHKCGYVHCDLKPENILLVPVAATCSSSGFVAKIADFGLAKKRKEKFSGWRGTPWYLSPEAFKDEKQDQSSDIWSLGCIVFEMLVGKSPWELKPGFDDLVDSYDAKMLDHLRTSKIPAGISYMAMDFLKSCLATKPGKRLTAEELLSHPFLAWPQPTKPGHVKVKLVNSALGHTYGVRFLKRSAEYHASGAIVPRIQPAPGFGIQAGV